MFERFTDQAMYVLHYAHDEARRLKCSIGADLILLGCLAEEDGLAAEALTLMGLTVSDTKTEIERIAAIPPPAFVVFLWKLLRLPPLSSIRLVEIPFTPSTKRLLTYGLAEAARLKCHHVSTEHILLGLIRESQYNKLSTAGFILEKAGISLTSLEQKIFELIQESGQIDE